MALELTNLGISSSLTVEAHHVSQSIDAFTGVTAYDIKLSGSFTHTGSLNVRGNISGTGSMSLLGNITASAFNGDGSGITGIISASHATSGAGNFSGSFIGDGSGLTDLPQVSSSITSSHSLGGNGDFIGNFSGSHTGSFTGSFIGDGSGLTGISASFIWNGQYDGDVGITGSLHVTQNLTSSNQLTDTITVRNNKFVKAQNGGGQLDLRAYNTDSQIHLTTDGGGGAAQELYMDASEVRLRNLETSASLELEAFTINTLGTLTNDTSITAPSFTGSFSGSFQGDGTNLTGITAEWDGSHVGDAEITGSLIVTQNITASNFTGSFIGDGSGLTGVTGEWDGTHVGTAQITGSTYISGSEINFISTKSILGGINNNITTAEYNIIGSGQYNTILTNKNGGIFGGYTNKIDADSIYGQNFILGGGKNIITGSTTHYVNTIVGGYLNIISASQYSFIGGGNNNVITHNNSFILGSNITSSQANTTYVENLIAVGTVIGDGSGLINVPAADPFPYTGSAIISGSVNFITTNSILGGEDNTSTGFRTIIGGGTNNIITNASHSFIGGGIINLIISNNAYADSVIVGGRSNRISGSGGGENNARACFIGSGESNIITDQAEGSSIVGGSNNIIRKRISFIGGGYNHTIGNNGGSGLPGVIVGGNGNYANGYLSFIGNGVDNRIEGGYGGTILNGPAHRINGTNSTILGGSSNHISSSDSSILGGRQNQILSGHNNTFILGSNITSSQANTTYVENLIASGSIEGKQGARITGSLEISGSTIINNILALTPQDPLPTTGILTGSFAVSGSTPVKPYFWDGTDWNALY